MTTEAENLIEYLGTLTTSQGQNVGQPFVVLPWQERFIRGSFDPAVSEAAISLARAGGKTTLLAGCAAAAVDGPLREPHGQVTIVAASFIQGRILGEHVLAFLGDKLEDKNVWRVWDTAQQFRIEHRPRVRRR